MTSVILASAGSWLATSFAFWPGTSDSDDWSRVSEVIGMDSTTTRWFFEALIPKSHARSSGVAGSLPLPPCSVQLFCRSEARTSKW